jgi:hypothetical protein
MDELLAQPRIQPGLFVGLSMLDWRHRLLLRWLYGQQPAPKDSLALLTPKAEPGEPELWDRGEGLPGAGRVAPLVEEPEQLALLLRAFAIGVVT